MRRSKKPKEKLPPLPLGRWIREVGWRHLVAFVMVLFALYPVVWIISASINPVDSLSNAKLIPEGATLDSYRTILSNPTLSPFMTWLWNSWKIAILAASFNVLLAAMAAYAFSRFRFKGRRMGLLSLLLVQVFPQYLMFIAIFLILQRIGVVFPAFGLNTHAGLILVYLGGAIGFNTFLIKGFMDSVPTSLDESARVDGAVPALIFWRIIMPLVRPILAVIFIITVINIFSEYVLARTLLRSTDQLTYIIGLQTYTIAEYSSKWGELAAGAVIGALPIVITFLVAQKAIVSGLTQGSVKG
ncbi:MAG: sugar ABC transporter permease [Actinomycetota bacterium]|nr:sugar ABC transporter permease [Actinomycetota bacterium]